MGPLRLITVQNDQNDVLCSRYIFCIKIIFLDKKFPFTHFLVLTLVNVCEVFVVSSYGGFVVPHMILVLLKCVYDSIVLF